MDTVKSSQEGMDLNGTARPLEPVAKWVGTLTPGFSSNANPNMMQLTSSEPFIALQLIAGDLRSVTMVIR